MADWTKKYYIPRTNLLAWHQYQPGEGAGHIIGDYSENNRTLNGNAANSPVLQTNVLAGQPGWYFNGSRDPLIYAGGGVTPKHIFIVASAEDATFSTYRGLLTDAASINVLVGDIGTNEFFDFSYGSAFQYKKSDVAYAESTQKAPVSGSHSVLEITYATGFPLTTIQIGQQTNVTSRLWKGYFFEQLLYSNILNDTARCSLYSYFARRYQLWQRATDGGLYIFPFPANRSESGERDIEQYVSQPYAGDPKALVRGGFENAFSLSFSNREQEEYDAVLAFQAQHRSTLTKFVFRDYRYYPHKDHIVRFASAIRRGGTSVINRFDYSFDVVETT